MYTALSNVLLAIFAALCIVALGVAAPVLTVAPGNEMTAATTTKTAGTISSDMLIKKSAGVSGTAEEATPQQEENSVHVGEFSQIKATNKHLGRLSNQFVRPRKVRSAEDTSDEDASNEDTSNEDPLANADPRRRDLISCVSYQANNTIPAAHIRGHGTRPFSPHSQESARLVKGYQQRWQCCSHNAHAFVDGGMIFNQTDKSLRVPICGYYHISSQIYYQIDGSTITNKSRSVYHLLKFERNCPSWPDTNPIVVVGKSSVSHDDTTTSTSDVVRLCAGGKVWVEIPDLPNGAPCCPIGDGTGTFISAHLIAETTCHWPPVISMQNFN